MLHTAHGYWIQEAGSPPAAPALEGRREFDVVVIGGGYTGMWTAWHISEQDPGARVAVVESDRAGHGPSGRNGGFADAMWISFGSLCRRYGEAAAVEIVRASEESVDWIGEFCEDQGIDAWFRKAGYLNVATTPAQDQVALGNAGRIESAGLGDEVTALDAGGVAAICRSPRFRGGVHYRSAATVQPARLAFGLRAALIENGVELFEDSPVTGVEDRPGGIRAVTARGEIRADRVVLANGPALAGRGSPIRHGVTLASSHIVITEPVPDVIEELGWTGGEAISDCRALLTYFRTTPDGRIALGWGGGRIAAGSRRHGRAELDPDVIAGVLDSMYRYFPALEGRRIEHAWGGPIDASATHLPHVVALPSGHAFAAFGYTGNGVGPSQLVGRALAALALGRTDRYSSLAFVERPSDLTKVPPEPFRWVGGTLIREAIGAKESAELEGRAPHPVSAAIARVPGLIGFHIGR